MIIFERDLNAVFLEKNIENCTDIWQIRVDSMSADNGNNETNEE